MKSNMVQKRAFTLIELLVVIAIIALLLAILMPALKKAKYQAKLTIDRNNLKNLDTAMQLYLTESNNRFFPYPDNQTSVLWLNYIGSHIDDIEQVRFCPETTSKIQEVETDFANDTSQQSIWGTSMRPWLWNHSAANYKDFEMGSYGFNGWFYAGMNTWVPENMRNFPFASLTDVKATGKTPLFLDANWVDGWPTNTNSLPASAISAMGNFYDTGDQSSDTNPRAIGRFVINRHGRKTNVAFMDMHVETITHEQLWTLSWHKGSQPNYSPVLPKPLPREK